MLGCVLTPKTVAKALLLCTLVLLVLNLIAISLRYWLDISFHSLWLFYFAVEGNFPTLFSTFLLLVSSFLLIAISTLDRERNVSRKVFWYFLAMLFFFLAMDEALLIHETFTDDTKAILGEHNTGGLFNFSWVIPYALFVLILTLLFLRFYLQLPKRTRINFALAATMFIGGALGLEMLEGQFIYEHGEAGRSSMIFMLMTTVEETLEMTGTILFIYELTYYFLERKGIYHFSFKAGTAEALKSEGKPATQQQNETGVF